MKKRRLMVIVSIMLVFVVLLSFSSKLFELKYVEIQFVDELGDKVSVENNLVYSSPSKINEVISSTSFDYGTLLFLINKNSYIWELERENPYIKIVDIEAIFPNKLILTARERKGLFYFSSKNLFYSLDDDFKILSIKDTNSAFVELKFVNNSNVETTFFDFFGISEGAYEEGLFIYENNLVFSALKNFYSIINSIFGYEFFYNISKVTIYEKGEDNADIRVSTTSPYGVAVEVRDILDDFDEKFIKVLNAFKTLENVEQIKTTYGRLTIDKFLNCYWYNL